MGFRRRSAHALSAAMAVLAITAPAVTGQESTDPGPSLARIPFSVGEHAEYQVRLGAIRVGSGSLDVVESEIVDGHRTMRTRLHVHGGIPFARVDTRMESWIDEKGLFSRRFEQDQHELSFERHRIFDFFPEQRIFRMRESGEIGRLASEQPLDDVSFIFYARTLPLKVGDRYTIPRYYKEDGNPVVIEVLRKQTIEVPAGTFETIVVQPTIKTDGLFGQGGEAELYFTDDDRRVLVHLRSRVPVVGSLNMSLRSYEPGTQTSR